LLWIGAAVLAALVIIAAVSTPPDTRPYKDVADLARVKGISERSSSSSGRC
jgi:hypothetical protein